MQAGVRRSNIMCCVVGCHNTYSNTDSSIKFYSFPGKWYEIERRKVWIQKVRRITLDKKPWEPKKHNKVCSVHFVGNEKSDDSRSPSYYPTIFPKQYRTADSSNLSLKSQRFLRNTNRSIKIAAASSTNINKESSKREEAYLLNIEPEMLEMLSADFSQQVNFDNNCEDFIFESFFNKDNNEISTQANIPTFSTLKSTNDKCVGNSEEIHCEGFHGYESLKGDQINSICGVTMATFALLLSSTEFPHKNCKLSIQNQLLLFLMKLKLGLSYSAIGILFSIHRSSASRIFLNLLNQLTEKFKTAVFWPQRKAIDTLLPSSFKIHYPKCRVIIDCTEIRIQCPDKIDDRIFTYSNYKGTFTAKFLIGIAPHGFISFISKSYGGRTTDSFITNDCGILDLLQPGDIVLADKGFPGIKCEANIIVVMPPFVHKGILTVEEVEDTYNVASVRIHVERSIQRIKIYKILDKIPKELFPYLDELILMCCILTNFQPKIINECEDD